MALPRGWRCPVSYVLHVCKHRTVNGVNEINKRELILLLGFLKPHEQLPLSGDARRITNQFAFQLHEDDNGCIRTQLAGDTVI